MPFVWGAYAEFSDNDEVRAAHKHLLEVVIPQTAQRIAARWREDGTTDYSPAVGDALVREMKLSGVNTESLGLLRKAFGPEDNFARRIVLAEIVARTLKNLTSDTLRSVNATSEEVVASILGGLINLYFMQKEGDCAHRRLVSWIS